MCIPCKKKSFLIRGNKSFKLINPGHVPPGTRTWHIWNFCLWVILVFFFFKYIKITELLIVGSMDAAEVRKSAWLDSCRIVAFCCECYFTLILVSLERSFWDHPGKPINTICFTKLYNFLKNNSKKSSNVFSSCSSHEITFLVSNNFVFHAQI